MVHHHSLLGCAGRGIPAGVSGLGHRALRNHSEVRVVSVSAIRTSASAFRTGYSSGPSLPSPRFPNASNP